VSPFSNPPCPVALGRFNYSGPPSTQRFCTRALLDSNNSPVRPERGIICVSPIAPSLKPSVPSTCPSRPPNKHRPPKKGGSLARPPPVFLSRAAQSRSFLAPAFLTCPLPASVALVVQRWDREQAWVWSVHPPVEPRRPESGACGVAFGMTKIRRSEGRERAPVSMVGEGAEDTVARIRRRRNGR
jgi:hypothetical protein